MPERMRGAWGMGDVWTWMAIDADSKHLRGEMAKTEWLPGVEPDAGTRVGQSGQNAPEVVKFTDERRGSSVAEQLIRNQ